jgi:hypothetical protein
MVLIMVTFTRGLIYLGPTQGRTSRCLYCQRGGLFGTIKLIESVNVFCSVGLGLRVPRFSNRMWY